MRRKHIIGIALLGTAAVAVVAAIQSCRTIPKGAVAVKPFDVKNYLGKWYEIARLDFKFERNLDHTTAQYSLRPDGKIRVLNRGYNYKTGQWKQAIGKAKWAGDTSEAKLKVSFFGPFYAGYNVIALDADYRYALVAGKNLDYLWLLSREQSMPEAVKAAYLRQARQLGYDTARLVWVKQDK
jgi:apolipoprotein D and lipocalin family protein